jgi:hypothetical protein
MKKSFLLRSVCAGVITTASTLVYAAAINEVDYFSLSGSELIDFNSAVGGDVPGTNYDGIINLSGASFAERFVGQTLTYAGNSDVLSGVPTGSLSLQIGAAGQNLNLVSDASYPYGNLLSGVGNLGFPSFEAIGEGAVAILFDNDQSEFGFYSFGGNLGPLDSATFEFWARDGSLIATLTPTNLGSDYYGFSRESGIKDIAGISIWNTDTAGIGYDNIIFDVAGVPDVPIPAAVWLFGSGLLGLIGIARRKKAA